MLRARLRRREREIRLLDRRVDARRPGRLDGGDLLADAVAVLADVAQRDVPVELIVERDDADDCSSVMTSTAACAAALQRSIDGPAMLHDRSSTRMSATSGSSLRSNVTGVIRSIALFR